MLIDVSALHDADGTVPSSIAATLQGLRLRQAPFCVANTVPASFAQPQVQPEETAPAVWNKSGFLQTLQQLQADAAGRLVGDGRC